MIEPTYLFAETIGKKASFLTLYFKTDLLLHSRLFYHKLKFFIPIWPMRFLYNLHKMR